jgi:arylsulfatase A-like enzyme
LASVVAASPALMTSPQLPNIILVVMDTAGARRCSVYGHSRRTTPGLEAIAREGTLYRACFATSPWTIPSHLSLFSGLYPSELGVENRGTQVPEMFYTLPEVLGQMGYHTVGISCNGLVGHQRGFDVFFEMDTPFFSEGYHRDKLDTKFIKEATDQELGRLWLFLKYIVQKKRFLFPLQNVLERLYKKHCVDLYYKTSGATKRSFKLAKHLIRKYQGKQPLFLFLNFMETHWKYNPPLSYNNIIDISREERKQLYQYDHQDFYIKEISPEIMSKIFLLYEQGLYFLDEKLLDFYRFLEAQGVKDNTLLAITSDHGEALGEHGLWGHIFGIYNEILQIPLVVKYPRGLSAPAESHRLAQLNDLFATILEAVDAPLPLPESSRSLLSANREYAFAEHYQNIGLEAIRKQVPDYQPLPFMQPCRGVIDGDFFKLIEWADGRLELYDLNRDFEEIRDLSGVPDQVPRIQGLRQVMLGKLGPFGENA